MKALINLLLLAVVVTMYTDNSRTVTPKDIVPNTVVISQPTDYEKFRLAIAQLESNNTHDVVNQYGMMGKYQFSPSTVEWLGFQVDSDTFLQDPQLQDSVFNVYFQTNAQQLQDLIDRYDGKVTRGLRITASGILAGAHFAGATGVRRFLEDPLDQTGVIDGNGMSLRRYMESFSDYDLYAEIE